MLLISPGNRKPTPTEMLEASLPQTDLDSNLHFLTPELTGCLGGPGAAARIVPWRLAIHAERQASVEDVTHALGGLSKKEAKLTHFPQLGVRPRHCSASYSLGVGCSDKGQSVCGNLVVQNVTALCYVALNCDRNTSTVDMTTHPTNTPMNRPFSLATDSSSSDEPLPTGLSFDLTIRGTPVFNMSRVAGMVDENEEGEDMEAEEAEVPANSRLRREINEEEESAIQEQCRLTNIPDPRDLMEKQIYNVKPMGNNNYYMMVESVNSILRGNQWKTLFCLIGTPSEEKEKDSTNNFQVSDNVLPKNSVPSDSSERFARVSDNLNSASKTFNPHWHCFVDTCRIGNFYANTKCQVPQMLTVKIQLSMEMSDEDISELAEIIRNSITGLTLIDVVPLGERLDYNGENDSVFTDHYSIQNIEYEDRSAELPMTALLSENLAPVIQSHRSLIARVCFAFDDEDADEIVTERCDTISRKGVKTQTEYPLHYIERGSHQSGSQKEGAGDTGVADTACFTAVIGIVSVVTCEIVIAF